MGAGRLRNHAGSGAESGLISILDVRPSARHDPDDDGKGNVSEYINSNQSRTATLAAHFEYDPFGNLTAGTAANAEAFPYRFSTKPQDPVTGMFFCGYRWRPTRRSCKPARPRFPNGYRPTGTSGRTGSWRC